MNRPCGIHRGMLPMSEQRVIQKSPLLGHVASRGRYGLSESCAHRYGHQTMDPLLITIMVLAAISVILLVFVLLRKPDAEFADRVRVELDRLSAAMRDELRESREESAKAAWQLREEIGGGVRTLGDSLTERLTDDAKLHLDHLQTFSTALTESSERGEQRLAEMRTTLETAGIQTYVSLIPRLVEPFSTEAPDARRTIDAVNARLRERLRKDRIVDFADVPASDFAANVGSVSLVESPTSTAFGITHSNSVGVSFAMVLSDANCGLSATDSSWSLRQVRSTPAAATAPSDRIAGFPTILSPRHAVAFADNFTVGPRPDANASPKNLLTTGFGTHCTTSLSASALSASVFW